MSLSSRFIATIVSLMVVSCILVSGAVVWKNLAESQEILEDNGRLYAFLTASAAYNSPQTALNLAFSNDDVYAVALYDANFNIVDSKSDPDAPAGLPTQQELQGLAATIAATGQPAAVVNGRTMVAMDDMSLPNIKYAVVVLSTASAIDRLAEGVSFAFWFTSFFAVLAGVLAYFVSRRVVRPITALGRATSDLEAGHFEPQTLAAASKRTDELGSLARRFTEMAQEVQTRQRKLAAQLEALQVQIDEADRQRRVETITGTAEFADLEQRAAELRSRRRQQEQNPGSSNE